MVKIKSWLKRQKQQKSYTNGRYEKGTVGFVSFVCVEKKFLQKK